LASLSAVWRSSGAVFPNARIFTAENPSALERAAFSAMTVDASDARAIVALANKQRLHVVVPDGWNFKPRFADGRRLLADGRIGTIRHISALMAPPIGELMSGRAMPGTEKELIRPNPETWANPQNGGYGWGQLVHLLGGLFYVADLAPERVFALTGKSEVGADGFNSVVVQFAGDATAALSGAATYQMGDRSRSISDSMVPTACGCSTSSADAASCSASTAPN